MKRVIPSLQIGELVKAQVLEVQHQGYLILDFYGDLIRVKNELQSDVRKGQLLDLQVISLLPLQFQLFVAKSSKRFERTV